MLNYHWITYIFPVFRMGDFVIGACLGYIFRNGRLQISRGWATVLELLVVLCTFVCGYFYKHQELVPGYEFFRYTVIYAIPSAGLVLLFALKKGSLFESAHLQAGGPPRGSQRLRIPDPSAGNTAPTVLCTHVFWNQIDTACRVCHCIPGHTAFFCAVEKTEHSKRPPRGRGCRLKIDRAPESTSAFRCPVIR